jgi:hypothetical protein
MPKYAKIQNFRNRKTPRSAVTFFNSPFGLWLLSAIFLTVGGAALSARQECLALARSDIESFNRVSDELAARRLRLLVAVRYSSNSIDFLKTMQSNASANFKEFDGQSYPALIAQQRRISGRFDFSKQTMDRRNKMVSWGTLPTALIDSILVGITLAEALVDDASLKAWQEDFERLERYLSLGFLETTLQFEPACSFWRLAMRAIFQAPSTAVEIPRPDNELSLILERKEAPTASQAN